MDFLKSVTGKIVTGLVALLVVVCAYSWYEADPRTKDALITGTGKIAAWFGVVLFLPWLAFAVIGWVARMESNLAGAGLVGGLTLLELVFLGWMFHWTLGGRIAWSFFIVGALVSATYNVLTCDWIAEKIE